MPHHHVNVLYKEARLHQSVPWLLLFLCISFMTWRFPLVAMIPQCLCHGDISVSSVQSLDEVRLEGRLFPPPPLHKKSHNLLSYNFCHCHLLARGSRYTCNQVYNSLPLGSRWTRVCINFTHVFCGI